MPALTKVEKAAAIANAKRYGDMLRAKKANASPSRARSKTPPKARPIVREITREARVNSKVERAKSKAVHASTEAPSATHKTPRRETRASARADARDATASANTSALSKCVKSEQPAEQYRKTPSTVDRATAKARAHEWHIRRSEKKRGTPQPSAEVPPVVEVHLSDSDFESMSVDDYETAPTTATKGKKTVDGIKQELNFLKADMNRRIDSIVARVEQDSCVE